MTSWEDNNVALPGEDLAVAHFINKYGWEELLGHLHHDGYINFTLDSVIGCMLASVGIKLYPCPWHDTTEPTPQYYTMMPEVESIIVLYAKNPRFAGLTFKEYIDISGVLNVAE